MPLPLVFREGMGTLVSVGMHMQFVLIFQRRPEILYHVCITVEYLLTLSVSFLHSLSSNSIYRVLENY